MENTKKIQIVSCSGASNTGKYADAIARRMAADGDASMICLAKVAIGDQPLINQIKNSDSKIIVLDGIVKGKTPFSEEKAIEIINHIKTI